MKRRKDGIWGAKPLGNAVNALLKGTFDKTDRQLVTLITEWPFIAGEEIAHYCHPNALKRSRNEAVLKIAVESGYATFLQHQLPELQERIAQFLGAGVVTRIQLEARVMPHSPEAPKRKKSAKAEKNIPVAQTGSDALDDALASLSKAMHERH